MKRTVVLAVSVLALVATTASPAAGVAGFGDVERPLYYTEAVQWMVDNGITEGTTPSCFSPDERVTRGQLAAFLHRFAGTPMGSPPHSFVDVPAPWQQAPVSWLLAAGITMGTSATTFSPDAVVDRGQFAAFLHRLAGEPEPAAAHPFVDVHTPWQQDAVSWMVESQVTSGTTASTYSPGLPVTRGQLAAFLHRYAGAPAVTVDPTSPYCARTRTPRQVTETSFSPYAGVGPVTLGHPAAHVELIGFHESNHDGARQVTPAASAATNVTMESRRRGTGSRSAADIVVAPTDEIRSPVTGTVIRGGGYTLYCRYRDEFVVIEPDARPGWEVKVLHINGLRVGADDRVEAGVTVLATAAAQLPFVSQIDDLTTEPSWPHVHIEVVDPSIPDRPGSGC